MFLDSLSALLPDGTIDDLSLKNALGSHVFIYFYPGDFLPISREEIKELSDLHGQFRSLQTTVFACGSGTSQMHKSWVEAHPKGEFEGLGFQPPFSIFADKKGNLSKTFDMFNEENGSVKHGFVLLNEHGHVKYKEIVDSDVKYDVGLALATVKRVVMFKEMKDKLSKSASKEEVVDALDIPPPLPENPPPDEDEEEKQETKSLDNPEAIIISRPAPPQDIETPEINIVEPEKNVDEVVGKIEPSIESENDAPIKSLENLEPVIIVCPAPPQVDETQEINIEEAEKNVDEVVRKIEPSIESENDAPIESLENLEPVINVCPALPQVDETPEINIVEPEKNVEEVVGKIEPSIESENDAPIIEVEQSVQIEPIPKHENIEEVKQDPPPKPDEILDLSDQRLSVNELEEMLKRELTQRKKEGIESISPAAPKTSAPVTGAAKVEKSKPKDSKNDGCCIIL